MIKILTPPVFENSEKTRKAKLLHTILISSAIIITLIVCINIIIIPSNLKRWIAIISLFNLICFGLLLLNKKGFCRISSTLLIAFCIILSTTLSWTAGGIRSTAFQYLSVLVLLSGLLLGWKEGIVTGIVAIFIGLAFVLVNYFGKLPVSSVEHFPLSIWIASSTIIVLLALLQYFSIAGLDKALNKVTKELNLRRAVEADLFRSETFRKQVFEGSRVPIVVMDILNNHYIDCNEAAVDIYRVASREETLGKSPFDFSAPTQYDGTPSAEKAKYYIDKALQDGSVVFEWKHQRPDGELWDAEVHLMSFEADNKQLLQFTLLDITERKKTEKALHESEERFRLVLENMPILLNAFDENGHFIVWNKACEEVTGYSAEEMIGNPNAMDLLYPDSKYRQEVWNTSQDPANKNNTFDLVTKNGEIRTIEWFDTYHFLTIQGWASWGMGLDITERKLAEQALIESEERYRLLVENMPIGVVVSQEDSIVYANSASLHIIKVPAECDLVGKSIYDFIPQEYREKAVEQRKNLLPTSPIAGLLEYTLIRFDKTLVDIETLMVRITYNGQPAILNLISDITERKLAEKALQESEERFKTLSSIANEGIMINEDGIILDSNLAFARLIGYSSVDDIIGKNSFEIIRFTPESKQTILHRLQLKSDTQNDIELINPDGRIISMETRGTNIVYKGRDARLVFMRDITERKQAEEALKASEERFRNLSDLLPQTVFETDLNGKLSYVNQAAYNLFGYTPEDMSKGLSSFIMIIPEDRELGMTRMQTILNDNISSKGEYTALKKDGSMFPAIIYINAITRNKKIAGIRGVIFDITERKLAEQKLIESEARYRFISENSADVIWTLSIDKGKFTFVSPSVEKLRGFTADEVLSQTMQDALTQESLDKANQLFQNIAVRRKQGDNSVVKTISLMDQPCKNGSVVSTEVSSTLIFDENGIPSQVIGVSRDITERKLTEALLKESEAHYRYLFEQNPVPMLIYKLGSLELLAVNESFLRHYGYFLSEALALKLTDLYPEDEKLRVIELAQKLKGLAYAGQWHHIKKDGTPINVEAHSHGLLFEGQESRIAVINDITQLKNIEKELIINEGRLQKLLKSVTDYIYSVAIEKGVAIKTIHGEGCIAVTGYSADDYRNDHNLWYKIIYNDDKEIAKEQIAKLMTNNVVLTTEHRIIHKDGSIRWVRNTPVLRFNNDGELTGYDGLIVNITERKLAEEQLKESENRYRNLFENANDAIFIMKEDRFIDCNLMTTLLFDYPKEKIINMSPWELSPTFQPDGQLSMTKAQELISLCIEGKPQRFEWHHLRADTTIFDAEVSLNRLDLSGEVFILAIVRDISERKSFEKEVYFSTFKGEENERSRIARELHDGLGPLLSTCKIYHHNLNQLKLDSDETESYSKLGELLNESMFTIREISNNLSPHILRNFGLADAIKSFAEKLMTDIKFEINQNYEADKRYPEVIEVTLYRVIIELINNTIKHANASIIIVDLTEVKNQLFVRYKDDGEGFDYNETLKNAKGFGLFNIHSRIVSISGKIDYMSKKNKGIDVKISINL